MSGISKVTSGVPQGSVLGPTLFLLFVNDMPEHIRNNLAMFADDTCIYKVIENINDCDDLQSDLNALVKWSQDWGLDFNPDKCAVLRVGKDPPPYTYTMTDRQGVVTNLKESDGEKDLGVWISPNLNPDMHIEKTLAKANRVLFTIKRTITLKNRKIGIVLYKSLVRPIIEYCNSAWHPLLIRHIEAIESVQRRATRMLCGQHLSHLPYPERLQRLDMPTLAFRRIRGDMIECYKFTHGLCDMVAPVITRAEPGRTRGHLHKLVKERAQTAIRRNFFGQRVVNAWNLLPADVVEAPTLLTFKVRLDRLWKSRDLYIHHRGDINTRA